MKSILHYVILRYYVLKYITGSCYLRMPCNCSGLRCISFCRLQNKKQTKKTNKTLEISLKIHLQTKIKFLKKVDLKKEAKYLFF